MYVSFSGILDALHLDFFKQPGKKVFCNLIIICHDSQIKSVFAPMKVFQSLLRRILIRRGLPFLGLLILLLSPVWAQEPTFRSILTKDLNRLIPATTFSRNDKIYLHTVWTRLTGKREIKVLWIRPDKKVQETTRLQVNLSSNTITYTSWSWLSFKKGLFDFLGMEGKIIGVWKAQLFLDDTLLKEYIFTVS